MTILKLQGKRRVGIFRTVRMRIFLTMGLVFTLFCLLFSQYLFRAWRNAWLEDKQQEVSRYCSLIASEAAFMQYEGSSPDQYIRTELENLSRMFSYLRILVLDKNGKVQHDSSQSRYGVYIINDEVLEALAGSTAYGSDDAVYRMAVPIKEYGSDKVNGVIYAFAGLEQLERLIDVSRTRIMLVEFGGWIVTMIVMYFLSKFLARPVTKILDWLRALRQGQETKAPKLFMMDEYSEMVETVEETSNHLRAIDSSRSQFVSNVSHELKTPLSAIKVLTESLLLQDSVPEEVYKEFLGDINNEIDRMNNIVNDLLTLVRLEEGGSALNLKMLCINDMVDVINRRLQTVAEARGITLMTDYPERVEAEADEIKLTLAVSNLIHNAIKYNRENGTVTTSVTTEGAMCRIMVKDTGYGIEKEHFERLFDRFYRVDKARDRETGGSGLGLSIVRQIVNLHGGDVSVESVIGEGSTFTIRIPLDPVTEAEVDE